LPSRCNDGGRGGTKDPNCKWPGGVIPYIFYEGKGKDKKSVYTIEQRRLIYKERLLNIVYEKLKN